MMRFLSLLLLLLTLTGTVRAADTFGAMVTISPSVTPAATYVCYSDSRDIACGNRGLTSPSSGKLVGTTLTVTNAAFTRLTANNVAITAGGPPAGAVMAFNLASCPSGWSAYANAAGRTIFGQGTLGSSSYSQGTTGGNATVTMSAANMPAHNHSVDPPFTSLINEGSHTHGFDPPPLGSISPELGHTHDWDFANDTGDADGDHSHTFNVRSDSGSGNKGMLTQSNGTATAYTTESVDHTHNVNPDDKTSTAGTSHTHGINLSAFGSNGASVDHTHSITLNNVDTANEGSGTAMDMRPAYVGLLYCKKN